MCLYFETFVPLPPPHIFKNQDLCLLQKRLCKTRLP